ncbi:MAG: radical SAM protein [Clostridia bacterium]|nr:radical SAM protein [Clostridia bacterium]
MNYTGPVYRPPFEADSLLLQVTVGCSHNQCAFCTMYRAVPFSVCPMEQVEADIEEAARRWPNAKRVFLENGDPFVLSAERLVRIAEAIHAKLPRVETIAMYASIPNIRSKTDAELRHLRALGVNELNIGVESGLDSALKLMNKGHTARESIDELLRLKAAGMDFGLNIIFGAAGSDHWRENAEATAALLNTAQPYLIFTGTVHADPGCPLYEDMRSGAFVENTFGEYLDEEELLLELLDLENTYYFGLHPSNVLPMRGMLPRDKEEMLKAVQDMRKRMKDNLDKRPVRVGEGAIINR